MATRYHSAIAETLKDLREQMAKAKALEPLAQFAQSMARELPEELKSEISIGVQPGQLQGVLFRVYPKSMDVCTTILRKFAAAGFHQFKEPDNWAGANRRSWYLTNAGADKKGLDIEHHQRLVFSAFFYKEGSKCRFVKVGEKTEDIMELVCD